MSARWVIRTVGICGAVAAVAGCATSAVFDQELTKTNTQTVLAFQETVFNKHEAQEAFDHYVGPSFTQHDPHLASDVRRAALQAYGSLTRMFPASRMIVERTIAQGDLVAVQSHWERTPAAIPVAVVDIYRLQYGRIVEHWDVVQGDVANGAPPARAPGPAPL